MQRKAIYWFMSSIWISSSHPLNKFRRYSDADSENGPKIPKTNYNLKKIKRRAEWQIFECLANTWIKSKYLILFRLFFQFSYWIIYLFSATKRLSITATILFSNAVLCLVYVLIFFSSFFRFFFSNIYNLFVFLSLTLQSHKSEKEKESCCYCLK